MNQSFWKTDKGALTLLLIVSAILLLVGLGQRELWGAETRWANIALQMLQSGNYFDPYLKGSPYYDKPLPSYWLITASAGLMGGLGHWSLRLSSVIAAWLTVWLVYLIGERLWRKGTGLIAGWMLATTFYFVFWARVATADILTVFGVVAAIWWYWRGPDDTRLGRYTVFFLILALTSLLKGLIGFILPGLILLPHVLADGRWKRHLNPRLFVALVIAGALYSIPFVLSHFYGSPTYGESGLALVFLFFTLSGSRRSYYVLPLVPFAQLLAAWWVTRRLEEKRAAGKVAGPGWSKGFAAAALLLLLVIGVLYPWTNSGGGVIKFADDVRAKASQQMPWDEWKIVMIEVDNKVPMYMNNQGTPFYYIKDSQDYPRTGDSAAFMAWLEKTSGQRWDPSRTLIVTSYSKHDEVPLSYLSADHDVVNTELTNGARLAKKKESGSVAYIPKAKGL